MKGFECEEFLGFWQPSKTTCLLCCWAAAEPPLAVYTGAPAAPRCSVLMSGLETLLCLCSITGVWSRRWTDSLLLRLSSNCGFHWGKVSAGVAESAQMRPRTCGKSWKNWRKRTERILSASVRSSLSGPLSSFELGDVWNLPAADCLSCLSPVFGCCPLTRLLPRGPGSPRAGKTWLLLIWGVIMWLEVKRSRVVRSVCRSWAHQRDGEKGVWDIFGIFSEPDGCSWWAASGPAQIWVKPHTKSNRILSHGGTSTHLFWGPV